MSASPLAGVAPASTPLSRIAFGGFGRVALAGLLLVLAAVVVTMSGGAGLAGRVGSLFGVQSHAKSEPVAAVEVAGPVKAVVSSVRRSGVARSQRPAVHRRVGARRGPQQSPAPVAPRPAPALPPSEPVPPPVETPKPPPPAPSGNVQRTVETVRNTTAPLVPQAKPVLDQTAQTVSQACGLIGGCP
jgi:hypothetical protein